MPRMKAIDPVAVMKGFSAAFPLVEDLPHYKGAYDYEFTSMNDVEAQAQLKRVREKLLALGFHESGSGQTFVHREASSVAELQFKTPMKRGFEVSVRYFL